MQNTTPDHELKDLFTIDELIKESKRKDSKRNRQLLIVENTYLDKNIDTENSKRTN